MKVREFLADDRFLSKESREMRGHGDEEIRKFARRFVIRRAVACADGFTLSIQYSAGHYCNAREPFLGGEWGGTDPIPEPKSVEIGFPNRKDNLLAPYAEEGMRPLFRSWRYPYGSWKYKLAELFRWLKVPNWTGTVYGWVPIDVAERVVASHGGITHVRSDDHETWERVG